MELGHFRKECPKTSIKISEERISRCCYLNGLVARRVSRCLLDSGAEMTVVPESWAMNLLKESAVDLQEPAKSFKGYI